MDPATLHIATRLVHGENAIDSLGTLATEHLGDGPVLLVTDPGVAAVGHAERAMQLLKHAGVEVLLYEGVHENPTTLDVDACLEVARDADIQSFIGLGGGSPIDTARGCNFLLTNGGQMKDYWGVGKAEKPLKPMIAVPTTTGTGSEMQSFALIADAETHQKMACGDKKAAAKVAILDPTLSMTQPREVIAHTGLDCIGHALETAVTNSRTPFSQLFSREAWQLASTNFQRILDDPSDLEAQGNMLLASAFAGIAIEHSMLGAAHALANPLTARFDIVHGQAVGMMLPLVMCFNAAHGPSLKEYARLARAARLTPGRTSDDEALKAILTFIQDVLEHAGTPPTLADCGVTDDAVDSMADEASRQWTARFNPRELLDKDFRKLYRFALGK